jgi:uncharacterized membrane protein/protein-disulfide isomerase
VKRANSLNVAIAAISCLAAILATFLLVQSVRGAGVPGCGGGSSCDAVLSSRFSRVGPIPVSALAVPVFLMMSIGALRGSPQLLGALAVIASGAAIWFMCVQAFILHRFCAYCTITHALALVASSLIFWEWFQSDTKVMRVIPGAAVLLAAMIAAQLLIKPKLYTVTTTQPVSQSSTPTTSNQISLYNNRVTVDPADWPLFGSRRAQHQVVVMFDYTCSHCRREWPLLQQARQHYGTQIALIMIPLPLEPSCNPAIPRVIPEHVNSCTYTRYALAVFRADPSRFEQFHDRVMQGEKPPSLEQTRQIAEETIIPSAFAAALSDPAIEKHIQESVQLYRTVGGGPIPKLILPTAVIGGEIYPQQHLYDVLESYLDVKPLR